MANHSILSLRHIINRLTDLGVDTTPVLRKHGLDLNHIAPDSRIDCAREARIFCDLSELSDNPLAGLIVGGSIGFSGYGQLSFLLLTSATPYEALQNSVRFQALTYLLGPLGLRPEQQFCEITLQPLALPAWPFRQRIDMEMAGAFKLLRDLQIAAGIDLKPEQVTLPYSRPADSQAYEEHFGCPVVFGDTLARLRISNSKLQQAMPTADSVTNAFYRQQCEQLREVALSDNSSGFAEQVRQHLALFQHEFPDAPAVASAFNLSERSLRNHLREEGLSYRRLLDQLRFERACQRLRDSRDSIELIGQQLGYAEAASFIHAFQRWSGSSPARYRRQHEAQARLPAGNSTQAVAIDNRL